MSCQIEYTSSTRKIFDVLTSLYSGEKAVKQTSEFTLTLGNHRRTEPFSFGGGGGAEVSCDFLSEYFLQRLPENQVVLLEHCLLFCHSRAGCNPVAPSPPPPHAYVLWEKVAYYVLRQHSVSCRYVYLSTYINGTQLFLSKLFSLFETLCKRNYTLFTMVMRRSLLAMFDYVTELQTLLNTLLWSG